MTGNASCASAMVPHTFVSKLVLAMSSATCSTPPITPYPALLTTASRRPSAPTWQRSHRGPIGQIEVPNLDAPRTGVRGEIRSRVQRAHRRVHRVPTVGEPPCGCVADTPTRRCSGDQHDPRPHDNLRSLLCVAGQCDQCIERFFDGADPGLIDVADRNSATPGAAASHAPIPGCACGRRARRR